jgi:hypothetical protein
MSRNRVAILADLEQFNLDPHRAHRGTHANGRLAKAAGEQVEETLEAPVVETKPEVVESAPVVEEPAVVETVEEPVAVVEEEKPLESDEPKASEPVAKKKGKKQPTE